MTLNCFISLFLLIPFLTYGQNDSITSASLDSVINHIQPEKTKLILVKQGKVIVDSTLFRKVAYTIDKKEVKITARDYTYRTVPANECWGIVTDFGQCQRFYNGNTYIVWHTKSPYIYRDYAGSDRKINYFYSTTLWSEVLPLTKENIDEVADEKTIKQLEAYLKTHDIKKSKDGGVSPSLTPESLLFKDAECFTPTDFLVLHFKIAWAILEVLAKTSK